MEESELIEPFLLEGMRRQEKAVYIVDPKHQHEHRARLLASAPASELLEVTPWDQAHLQGGRFAQDRMIAHMDELVRAPAATTRAPMRIVGQMSWIFSSPPGLEQLVSYESAVNEVLDRARTPTVCVYDVGRLSGTMMMDLLRAHPLTVMNGALHENPFYTPPEQFLPELRARRRIV
jgi:hypothetical protein